jgi:hypothetical protein
VSDGSVTVADRLGLVVRTQCPRDTSDERVGKCLDCSRSVRFASGRSQARSHTSHGAIPNFAAQARADSDNTHSAIGPGCGRPWKV